MLCASGSMYPACKRMETAAPGPDPGAERASTGRSWPRVSRPDAVREIVPGTGQWGGWTKYSMCPPGQYALGFEARTEADQGAKRDDTALNALVLECRRPPGTSIYDSTYIKGDTIGNGIWGDWRRASCRYHGESDHGPWLVGARMKIEASGHKDETAANAFAGICQSGEELHVDNEGRWGDWQPEVRCEPHEAICGFATRVQFNQGDGDDTVLNGVKLMCCTLPTGGCGNGYCEREDCESCPADCGPCCGNGQCDRGETCSTCLSDCGPCCGNGRCDNGETCATCAGDCGACSSCPNSQCKPPCDQSTAWCSETCSGLCVHGNVCIQGSWRQQIITVPCNQPPPQVSCGSVYPGPCRPVPPTPTPTPTIP